MSAMLALTATAATAHTNAVASWYGFELAGQPTASGVPFDPMGYTAASKTLAFGTRVLVIYQGRSVVVTINDRGPFLPGRDIDLSLGAAREIGLVEEGVGEVYISTYNSY